MGPAQAADIEDRKRRGAWYTPPDLIDIVIDGLLDRATLPTDRPVRVVDPACGDGRFLAAAAERLRSLGHRSELTGCDIDANAWTGVTISDAPVEWIHGDALARDWGDDPFDLVVGNPPFLSQMAANTSRGGASGFGGGPYADAAAEFLELAVRLARPGGGRIALVLPQSILGSRDAHEVRLAVDARTDLVWSWWSARQQHFDASVNVVALAFERRSDRTEAALRAAETWTSVVTSRLGVPTIDVRSLHTDGTLGDRAELNANFRDEYYALVPAVSDEATGPPLVTSGLIDPGRCHWGTRPVRFAKQRFEHPRVDLARLTGRFPAWAARKLVPKVLVASQTRVIEAVADPAGAWLPGVPVTSITPLDDTSFSAAHGVSVEQIAAVLTSPVPSALIWQIGAGTGLSTSAIRIGPKQLADVPWPTGSLDAAVEALALGDLAACARLTTEAYGVAGDAAGPLMDWWLDWSGLARDAE